MTATERRLVALLKRDGSACHYCETPIAVIRGIEVLAPGYRSASVDHVIPFAAGGNHDLGNLVAACNPCNNDRGDMGYAKYRASRHLVPRPDVIVRANTACPPSLAAARREVRSQQPAPISFPYPESQNHPFPKNRRRIVKPPPRGAEVEPLTPSGSGWHWPWDGAAKP